jgi:hypothetical protein
MVTGDILGRYLDRAEPPAAFANHPSRAGFVLYFLAGMLGVCWFLAALGVYACTTKSWSLCALRRFWLERRPWRRPLAGNAGVPAGVEPDGGTNAAMAG